MPIPIHSTISSILFTLSLLTTVVVSYDCSQLATYNQRCPTSNGSMVDYPTCLVRKFSFSAFIQCANVKGPDAPRFRKLKDGEYEHIGVLEVLFNAVNLWPCCRCPLAGNIQRAAREHGLGDFRIYLCDQIHPVDAGMCCLRRCLEGIPQEHSIEAFCNGQRGDLMQTQPLVPVDCVSNAIVDNSATTDDEDGSGSDDESVTTASWSDEEVATSMAVESVLPSTIPAAVFTTAPAVNNTAAMIATTTSSLAVPPETLSTGAGPRVRATSVDPVKRIGCAVVVLMLAAF
ncbi:MAG: hypothetical protein Q9214_002126 [Letrouitia sp. 1 TL-2023]